MAEVATSWFLVFYAEREVSCYWSLLWYEHQ